VTQLRKMMPEELQRRNYAQNTVNGYLRIVQDFAQHFHQRPDKLGPDHLRQYQAHLFQDRKLNAGTVQQYVAALRFFFNKTLKRGLDWAPKMRQPVKTQFSLNGKGVYGIFSKTVHKRVQGSRRKAAGTGGVVSRGGTSL